VELVAIELVSPAEVVDDVRDGAALLLVPLVLGELVVADDGAVGVLALGFTGGTCLGTIDDLLGRVKIVVCL